jgi:hypothetical protein
LHNVLAARVGLATRNLQPVGSIEHLFTHRRLRLEVFRCLAEKGARVRLDGLVAHEWVHPKTLLARAHSGSTRKALMLLGVTDESSARAAGRSKP